MKNFLCLMLFASTLIACERQDRTQQGLQTEEDSDNTGKNVRDRNSQTITPLDQSENEVDRKITQQIRQALMSDDSLSVNAKNIKIITIDGIVTLRGPIANRGENRAIVAKLEGIRGIKRVDNQLENTNN